MAANWLCPRSDHCTQVLIGIGKGGAHVEDGRQLNCAGCVLVDTSIACGLSVGQDIVGAY